MPRKTILVVEDERPLLEAIKLKLENSGLEVVTARTVEQAVSYLTDLGDVDAIWLDHYLLGKESGLDMTIKLKAEDSPWRKIPIFIVSNTASEEKVRLYMQFGVEKYFVKSNYRLDEIIDNIQETLSNVSTE